VVRWRIDVEIEAQRGSALLRRLKSHQLVQYGLIDHGETSWMGWLQEKLDLAWMLPASLPTLLSGRRPAWQPSGHSGAATI
jgi:hypothetical protein